MVKLILGGQTVSQIDLFVIHRVEKAWITYRKPY